LYAIEQVVTDTISQPEGAKFSGSSVATFKRRLKEKENKRRLCKSKLSILLIVHYFFFEYFIPLPA
jgi:hypothetical protein